MWGLVVTIVASLASGGLIGVFLKHRLDLKRLEIEGSKLTAEQRSQLRQEEREDFKAILQIVTGQRDEANGKVRDMETRFENFELEIQGLRLAQDFDPFPSWMIDLDGRYLYINREFERQFLRPIDKSYREVIGKTHPDLWPAAFCEVLKNLDLEARRRPDGRARATTAVHAKQVTVHKFPVRVRGVIVAFAGYITDIEDERALVPG